MKNKKILILLAFAAVLSGVFFLLRPTTEHKDQIIPEEFRQEAEEGRIDRLTLEAKEGGDLIYTFEQMNVSIKNNLNTKEQQLREEIEKSRNLQAKLKEFILQNEILNKELASTKANLVELKELTQPIRRRFEGIEDTFEAIEVSLTDAAISPREVRKIRRQLVSAGKKLDAIDRQIPGLIQENKSYRKQAETLKSLLGERDAQVQDLENEQAVRQKELEKLISAKSILEKNSGDLEEKNILLNQTLSQLKEQLKNSQADYEQLSLERESLISQIEQEKNKISQLDQKLSQRDYAHQQLQGEYTNLKTKQEGLIKELTQTKGQRAELDEQLNLTRAELEKLDNEHLGLKKEYSKVQARIAQNEIKLAKRAERILNFQDRLALNERKIEELQKDSRQQKQESTSLRKQYVIRQLENETLKDQLNRHKQRLAVLQTQIIQIVEVNSILQERLEEISKIFKDREVSPFPETDTGKVDVELLPEEMIEVEPQSGLNQD